jgi:hypothetical protein
MEMDVARFAIATAIRLGRQGAECGSTQTKWNVGTFDRDGSLRRILLALFPGCSDCYRKAEQLLQEGLMIMRESQSDTGVPDIRGLVAGCIDPASSS